MEKSYIEVVKEKGQDLTSYITLVQIRKSNKWMLNYKMELQKGITHGQGKLYVDPDGSYKKNKSHLFYIHLADFLNKRESELADKLKEKFEYEFDEDYPGGIKVKVQEKVLFKLRSDQFGFSAPQKDKLHPYMMHLTNKNYSEEAIDKVIDCIIYSRTIGGSFLWPLNKDGNMTSYNRSRGGTVFYGSYIQDRVDLTLLEIKHAYNYATSVDEYCNDILYKVYYNENEYIRLWLEHFVNFETYVEFFMMEPFIGENGRPLSLISDGELDNKVIYCKEIKQNIDFEALFDKLIGRLVNRSISMEKIIY